MTPYAKEAVSLQTLLLFIDARKVIPYPPEMGKSRFTEETEELPVGPFGRLYQVGIGILDCRDGAEEQIAAHGGGNVAILIEADGVIAAPDFASGRTFEQGKIQLNDGA